jgi:hypothetical protein
MQGVEGSTDSLLHIYNGSVLSLRLFSGAIERFELFNEIDEYKLVQKKVIQLRCYVVRRPSTLDTEAFRHRVRLYLVKSARLKLEDNHVDVELVDTITVGTEGKHWAIISEVT